MKAVLPSRKQLIIDAAADLFQDKGYSATSIRALATKVGLEPSSIYSHIRSKEELLVEICTTCSELFIQGMDVIRQLEVSPDEKMRSLIQLHIDIAYKHPASVTVFNDEWKFLPENTKVVFLSFRKDYENNFKEILANGKKERIFEFDNLDILFSIIMKMLSWSYTATKKYKKSLLEAQLCHSIMKTLSNQDK